MGSSGKNVLGDLVRLFPIPVVRPYVLRDSELWLISIAVAGMRNFTKGFLGLVISRKGCGGVSPIDLRVTLLAGPNKFLWPMITKKYELTISKHGSQWPRWEL